MSNRTRYQVQYCTVTAIRHFTTVQACTVVMNELYVVLLTALSFFAAETSNSQLLPIKFLIEAVFGSHTNRIPCCCCCCLAFGIGPLRILFPLVAPRPTIFISKIATTSFPPRKVCARAAYPKPINRLTSTGPFNFSLAFFKPRTSSSRLLFTSSIKWWWRDMGLCNIDDATFVVIGQEK